MPSINIFSLIIAKVFKLPPAETYQVAVQRDLPASMPDGVVLLADRYYPVNGSKEKASAPPPLVLVRTPYGRGGLFGYMYGRLFAERGFQVLVQSTRGTGGSGGSFYPYLNEQADGLATLQWIQQQEWFSGALGTVGASYMGFVQWAIASGAGDILKAMAIQMSTADIASRYYPGGTFALHNSLTWAAGNHNLFPTPAPRSRSQNRRIVQALNFLPLREADVQAIGQPIPFWRDWLDHPDPRDPFWENANLSARVPEITVPIDMTGGWYDIFLPLELVDYAALRKAGRQPHLTIGPWTHSSFEGSASGLRESLAWLRAHLLDDLSGMRQSPVRLFIMGANEWRDFPDYPPAESRPQEWYLQPGGILSTAQPPACAPDHFRYDPAQPTPYVGGTTLMGEGGPKDNRSFESRPDVLLYTSDPVEQDMEVIGPVCADFYVSSTNAYTDFYARLCDVFPSGKSINLCDGIIRLEPDRATPDVDGIHRIHIDLWPTANRFRRGHRIRLQVTSGGHPRFARNPGSGEPLATATRLVPAEQTVYHDPNHPSVITLPRMEQG